MEVTETVDNDSGIMKVDDSLLSVNSTQKNDQPNSQGSTSSDLKDEITSNSQKFQISIRESADIAEIKTRLKKSMNINYQNGDGNTALHLAVRRSYSNINREIVDLLIRSNADVKIQNLKEKTPLMMVEEHLSAIKAIKVKLECAEADTSRKRKPFDETDSAENSKLRRLDANQSCRNGNGDLKNSKSYQPCDQPSHAASGLRLNLHGTIYQVKLLALFVERALQKKFEFCLESEVGEAEKFDDVVFKYQSGSDEWKWRFVQAKHKQDITKNKIKINDLKSIDFKNDFSLFKYFISFCKITKKKLFKGANFEDFSIITNTEFDFIDRGSSKNPKHLDDIKSWQGFFHGRNKSRFRSNFTC